MQRPAGEHCFRKARGDFCLMWHPPNEKVHGDEEDERQMNLAIERSLEQQVRCHFCGTRVVDIDHLQDHQLNCWAIESAPDSHETQNPAVNQHRICKSDAFSGVGNPEIFSPVVKPKSSRSSNSLHDVLNSSLLVGRRSIVIETTSTEVEGGKEVELQEEVQTSTDENSIVVITD